MDNTILEQYSFKTWFFISFNLERVTFHFKNVTPQRMVLASYKIAPTLWPYLPTRQQKKT